MKKITLIVYRFLFEWVIPITLTILIIALLLWERNIPVGSGMFYTLFYIVRCSWVRIPPSPQFYHYRYTGQTLVIEGTQPAK